MELTDKLRKKIGKYVEVRFTHPGGKGYREDGLGNVTPFITTGYFLDILGEKNIEPTTLLLAEDEDPEADEVDPEAVHNPGWRVIPLDQILKVKRVKEEW